MSIESGEAGEGTLEEGGPMSASDGDGLVSRLRVIEDQPLETRADAYAALHAELKAVLDSADRTAG